MVKRLASSLLLAAACVVVTADTAVAQQTLNFSLGGFVPHHFGGRVDGDTLVENRDFLVFDMDEFNGFSINGEWLLPIGQYFEAGAGLGFYRGTTHSVYADFEDSDGTEIDQELKLRIVPVSFTVRVLPLGQSNGVQPYFGAGLGIFNWRYSEDGEFVDFRDGTIFNETFVADGNETGPIAFGGIRFAADTFSVGGEIRYQSAEADLPDDFVGPRLDLGGWTYSFTFGLRFR